MNEFENELVLTDYKKCVVFYSALDLDLILAGLNLCVDAYFNIDYSYHTIVKINALRALAFSKLFFCLSKMLQ